MLVRAVALVMLLVAHAHAQPSFTLSDDGGWVARPAPEPGSDAAIIAEARRYLADDRPSKARSILNKFISKNEFTDNPWLAEAYLLRGDAKAARNEFKALYDYETVIREFPASPEFVRAVERELEIGVAYLNGLKRKSWFFGLRIDGGRTIGEELLIRVQERMVGSELAERALIELADYYYRSRDMTLAAEAYEIFVDQYPESRYTKRAMQQRIYANIARFKGPRYDASGLLEARLLIEDFERRFPVEAERSGINTALVTRVDESAAAQKLGVAKWYIRRGDEPAARFTLRRTVSQYPETTAAADALRLLQERGWSTEPTLVPAAPEPTEPPEQAAPAEADESDSIEEAP